MKKYIIFLLLSVFTSKIHAQGIQVDLFGNLKFNSRNHHYQAYLKKDIFDNLIFSDSHNNELRFKKDYLELNYNHGFDDEEGKRGLFRQFIDRYIYETGYKATYGVDLFGKVFIEDNLNNRVETGMDIFGNPTYEEKRNGLKITIRRDLAGNLEYRSGRLQAYLKKNMFDRWNYSDNSGNNFEFSQTTWQNMSEIHGNEEEILLFLIGSFLNY
jgi:hypothetical protein